MIATISIDTGVNSSIRKSLKSGAPLRSEREFTRSTYCNGITIRRLSSLAKIKINKKSGSDYIQKETNSYIL